MGGVTCEKKQAHAYDSRVDRMLTPVGGPVGAVEGNGWGYM